MHDVHLVPLVVIDSAEQLTASERTDSYRERTTSEFFSKADKLRLVEFFGPMDGKTPRRTTQYVRQHGDFGRVGPEVRMQVLHASGF